jgi:predicted hotdog family 3-hydroxylacyl-ACP dehydratase
MSIPPIAQLVPHDGQMVLLDRVLSGTDDTLCAEVTIAPHTVFLVDGVVGSWVGMEYMAQAIAAHNGYKAYLRGEPPKVGFLLGARRYQCSVPAFTLGSVLHVRVQHAMQGDNGLAAFECRIDDAADGTMLAHATITVFEPDNVNEFLQRSFT